MERTLDKPAAQVLVPPIAITDGELLMQFARHGDEQAFAAIVEKHGRLVWAVCWQVLREHHAIEDAFQSTFFILAKRARSIRSCDSLCAWLYRVAYRTALRARMSIKAQPLSALGTEAETMQEWSEFDDKLRAIEQDEQRAALLEELQSLPEKYQQALTLCYLEGKTRRTIADELGCSLETVKGRLARGRQVLRHRLVRRGVSLSLAMAAMTVPVKAAAAAVSPSLIGLTVTGATAWTVGTLTATKTAGGVGIAKAASTSAHVVHLAQQGTVAMTIASFAKPAVVAVALLGAVSGTLAVDSREPRVKNEQLALISLTAEEPEVAEEGAAAEAEAPVITVAAAEEAKAGSTRKADTLNAPLSLERKRSPAPTRSLQSVENDSPERVPAPARPADVLVPAMSPMPEVPAVAPLNVRTPKLDLKLQLQMAVLETKVSELQLEAKQLEVAAHSSEDEKEKEELLRQSRERLTMAEAEKIKIQLEQQRAQIEELQKLIEAEAAEIGRQATEVAINADQVAMEAEKAASIEVARAVEHAKGAAHQAAHGANLKLLERSGYLYPGGRARVTQLAKAVGQTAVAGVEGALSLHPGDQIEIEAIGVLPDRPIQGTYTIEPMGTVALGAAYGRAEVAGLSVIEAEAAIKNQLSKVVADSEVQVTFVGRPQTRILAFPAPVSPNSPTTRLPIEPTVVPGEDPDQK